ncbi:MAG: PQQ-like beta-propeller repeat protein [Planctomycetes bacterium]|nr:PQQ-like beta-propeller repeat protein [Planctomycetota bacterium]
MQPIIILFFLVICSCSYAQTGEWHQFHGPNRLNISPDTALLKKWPAEGPPKLWTFGACGKGYSGVIVAEGLIFTAGDFADKEFLIALDLNGNIVWKEQNGKAWKRSCPGSRATPTYNEGIVYHMNPLGHLTAYQAKTGKTVWKSDLRQRFGVQYGIWALAESVLVDGDKLLCMPGGSKGRIVALNKKTGETLWTNTEIQHGAAYCSGRIINHKGKRQMITLTSRSLISVALDDGKLLWQSSFVPRSPQNALTPLYHQGHVFVASGHKTGGRMLKISEDSKSVVEVWTRSDIDDCHSGTLLVDGRLYGVACRMGYKNFYCLDYLSGKSIKLDPSFGKVGITYADGMIYAINHRGMMYLLETTKEGFELSSQFQLPKKPTNSYLAHPVVIGGRLYLRCGQELHVFDVSDT